MADARVTLVTGFPQFRAAELVGHLLASPADEVLTVVRARDLPLVERYRAAMPEAMAARWRCFEGDPAAIDMGLSGQEFREISGRVTCIQHLAQAVGPTFGKEPLEELNIGSMREVLELALAAPRLTAVVAHSSVVVSGDREGLVDESELVTGQRFSGPGPATLARAELMARRQMDRLPIVIVRGGQVVSSTRTGATDTLEGVNLLILLILNSPQDLSALLPDWGEAPLHVVPLEHFVQAADALSRQPSALGQTLHLTDPKPMTVRLAFNRCLKIRDRMAKEGIGLPPPSVLLRKDGVLRDSLQSILWRPRTFINASFRNVHYGTSLADGLLAEVGLACPPLESYFEGLVRHVVRSITLASTKPTA